MLKFIKVNFMWDGIRLRVLVIRKREELVVNSKYMLSYGWVEKGVKNFGGKVK